MTHPQAALVHLDGNHFSARFSGRSFRRCVDVAGLDVQDVAFHLGTSGLSCRCHEPDCRPRQIPEADRPCRLPRHTAHANAAQWPLDLRFVVDVEAVGHPQPMSHRRRWIGIADLPPLGQGDHIKPSGFYVD